MKIYINGNNISKEQLTIWKRERIKKVLRTLGYRELELNDTDTMIKKLTDLKMRYSYKEMHDKLKFKLRLSGMVMRVCAAISGERRKFSKTEIFIEGITAEEAIKGIDCFMLKQSQENDQVNLSACPDHYVLRPLGDKELEVIEATGNSPFPVQFFIAFDDEAGLKTPRDDSYQYQSVGVARMKAGTIIGGVRHQFKDTNTGIAVSLVVEFPALCPTSLVESHQMHLACEFSYWLQSIKNQISE